MSLVTISNELDDCGTDLATDIMVGYCLETVPELAESSSINSYPSGIIHWETCHQQEDDH